MSWDPDLDGTEVRIHLYEAFGFVAGGRGDEREFDGGKARVKGKGELTGGWREE